MSKLSWVTPQGTVASMVIGVPTAITLLAANASNNGAVLSYRIISGELPPGITINTNGVISGTPSYTTSSDNYFVTRESAFIVRVTSSDGVALDGSFKIIAVNGINGDFNWVTPAGNLGTVPDGAFYSLQLEAYDAQGNPVSYSFISGELPGGMQLLTTGYLQGVPTLLSTITVDSSQTFKFTARATNSLGHINDRAFSITVTSVYSPIIQPYAERNFYLGSFFDGAYFTQQLNVIELNPNVVIKWSIINGTLPGGVTLSSNGLLSGYIQPLQLIGKFGPSGFDGDAVVNEGPLRQEYDYAPYDFNQLNQSLSYNFTVQAYDGSNYDLQTYVISVVSRSGYTADSTVLINDTYLTVDSLNVYSPAILNASIVLPTARQNSYYAFKFEGYDFQGDELTYSISNTAGTFDAYVSVADEGFDYAPFDSASGADSVTNNLPGLVLDPATGWLYGKLNPQNTSYEIYTFGVQASKIREGRTYKSAPIFFTLPVLGDVNNLIQWISPANLGVIDNGAISELAVTAKSLAGRTDLTYRLYDKIGVPIRLPQGLTLLPSGNISGRVTFEATDIDQYATTFDGTKLTLDRVYNFTVVVSTSDNTAAAVQEFTLKLNIVDQVPHEELHLKAMTAHDQRKIYSSVISDPDIFANELIYRSDDPWFGANKDLSMLFVPGLTPSQLDQYQAAIVKNHYTKMYNFGEIKSAVVLDKFYNVKYEVVYIDMLDPSENASGKGAPLSIDLTEQITNPYIDAAGEEYRVVYPNSSSNMLKRLVDGIGYADQSTLPEWMTSNQPDPANPTKFKTPLGFTKAVVIAYTKPGTSKLIAYRLRNAGINFNNIEFTVDRYLVDSYYSSNFDTTTQTYITGRETTFDYLPNNNIGTLVASVNYGLTVPFSSINGKTVEAIRSLGGIDGSMNFKNGETLIFVRQENFMNPGPYDGWAAYTDAWIGNNTLTPAIEGYDSGSYDKFTVVPGFLEKTQGTIFISKTDSSNNQLSVDRVDSLTVGAPIYFQGAVLGGLTPYDGTNATIYYIRSIIQEPYLVNIGGILQTAYLNFITLSDNTDLSNFVTLTNSSGSDQGMAGYLYTNQRGGVWQINIVDSFVNLVPLTEVSVNQRVRVLNGSTYGGAILYYSNILYVGQTVPYYEVYQYTPNLSRKRTTFNGDSTKFFNYRDQYYTPNVHDKYVKFPQFGVFN